MTRLLPRFSPEEYSRRYALVENWLGANGLDALLLYANRYGNGGIRWLSGFAPRHDAYLLWPRAGEPVLLLQLFNHVPDARRVAVLDDVQWTGPQPAQSVLRVLRERKLENGAIGVAGRVPYVDYETLTAGLPGVTWQPAGKGFTALRLVKSDEEAAWLRQGAAYTDAALQALVDAVRPGATEWELAAAIEAAYTGHGGEHGIHFLSSTPMDAPESYVPAQTQTGRRLQVGDAIICELSAGVGGYAGQIHRLLTVGRAPTPTYRRLYDVALAAYEQIVSVLRAGATVGDVLDAADDIAAQGLTVCDDLLHGYGMGYLPPVVRTRQTAHSGQPPSDFRFETNMAVVVQPNVVDPQSGAGLQVGNLLLITSSGAEALQHTPLDIVVCRSGETA